MKRTMLNWIVMVSLVLSAVITPIIPAATAYAAGETKYEAESAAGVDVGTQTVAGAVYSGTGYRDLGDKANASSLAWSTVQAAAYGNYMVKISYSNTDSMPKPISLSVNGQKFAVFAGSQTGTGLTPVWGSVTAVVMLNPGNNIIKVSSESTDGPQIDVLEVTPFSTIFEAENGGGAAHSNVTIAANTGTAPGFSGTGYASVAAGVAGYMQYNNVVVPQTGKYTLKIRYTNGSTARPYAITVNGSRIQDAKGTATGAWASWRFEELTGVSLNAGVNTLKIERIGTNATPVIDRFELVTEALIELGDQTFRTTTFETSDVDAGIAGTATGAALNSALINGSALKSTSASTVKVVESAGSRWAEVTTPATKQGIIGFPFHASWLAPVPMKNNTLESSFMLKDDKANYIFKLVSAGGLESPIFAFGMDNQIYARSDSSAGGALAARASWSQDTAYKVKLVLNLDTKSYDMYLNDVKIVNSEPLQNDAYLGGLRGFFLEVKDGARQETKILVDNIQLSGSNATGTTPVINPNPGSLFVEQPYIGQPVVYYVSPAGLDTNNGLTTTTAFKTINKAVSVTNPGDTVNIMPGTYSAANDANDFVLINRSGAKDAKTGVTHYITYKAYDPQNMPKLLLPPNTKGVWDMVQVDANYIIVDGLEIEGANLSLTLAEGEANYNSKVAGGADWATYAKTNTNGISFTGHHIIVKNNHVHHLAGAGVGGGGDYITVDGNDIHSNSWFTMYATSGISFMNDYDTDNNTTDYKIIIRNNRVYDNETKVKWERTKGYSDGNGIIFDVDEAYKGKKLVVNNIVYNNGGGGIHAYRSNNIHVINNTIYHNSRSPHLKYPNMDAQSADNSVFLNNISIARDEEGEYANLNSGWNNLFAYNVYGGNVRFLGQNERVIDPKFVSVTGATYDFHLQADSPAIDQGTRTNAPDVDMEGNVRPYAGAGSHERVDIGAYETTYNSSNPLVDDAVQFIPAPPDQVLEAKASQGTPAIDGQIDGLWASTPSFQALKISDKTKEAPLATMRLLWDEHNLYVLAEVKDANLNATGGNLFEHDSMEFFIDENNGDTVAYQSDDSHYRVNYLNLKSVGKNATTDSFTSAATEVEGGYVIEAALPLRTITGAVGTVIGFDAGASDDSNFDGIRDNATMWSNQRFNSHMSTQWFGNVSFVDVAAPAITSIQPVQVSTTVGTAPSLPTVVTAVYSDDSTSTVSVIWDTVSSSSYGSAGTFTVNGTVGGTALKAVANVTVTAANNPGGGGSSGSGSTPTAPVLEGSTVKVTPILTGTVAASELTQELLLKLLAQTPSSGTGAKKAVIEVKPVTGAESYVQDLPAKLFQDGDGANLLEIQTAIGTVTVPDNMLKAADLTGASKVELSIAVADISNLNKELKDKIGQKPVLDLAVLVDGKRIEWKNNRAPVTVSIPYQPTAEELKKPEHIAIWYLDGDGKVVKIPSGKYNAATGKVTFTTTHFSQYAVGYEVKSFADLESFSWAQYQIEVLVSKGVINGKSDTTFSPSENITRADFIVLLVRAFGLEADVTANFADVNGSDYYYSEVGVARALGITDGIGNNQFLPKQPITRQDMMVLTARAMKAAGKALPKASAADLKSFSDSDQVSDYAKDSMAALVKAGFVQGDGANISSRAYTSRAEVAVLIYRIYMK